MTRQELDKLHFGLGLWIRNRYLYDQGGQNLPAVLKRKKIQLHTDTLSSWIIEAYWSYLHRAPCDPARVRELMQQHQIEPHRLSDADLLDLFGWA